MNRIFPLLEKIGDARLKELTGKCWEAALKRGGWKQEDLHRIPFTLLETRFTPSIVVHTNGVTETALATAIIVKKAYSDAIKIDLDVLISGGLLHDVGKVLEYSFENGKFVKSKIGRLIRHPVSGAALASEVGLPPEVVHIIASHSFEGDKTPRSVEAILVHHADFANFEVLGGKA